MGRHSDLWARLVEALCRYEPSLERVTLLLDIPFDADREMCVTCEDLQVHPAFEPLRVAGRFGAEYRSVILSM